jgi:large subunit ribosomal protein L29
MKMKELKNLTDDELVAKEQQIKKDMFALNNQRQLGRVEKPSNFRNFRRDIARILTELTERKNNGNSKRTK